MIVLWSELLLFKPQLGHKQWASIHIKFRSSKLVLTLSFDPQYIARNNLFYKLATNINMVMFRNSSYELFESESWILGSYNSLFPGSLECSDLLPCDVFRYILVIELLKVIPSPCLLRHYCVPWLDFIPVQIYFRAIKCKSMSRRIIVLCKHQRMWILNCEDIIMPPMSQKPSFPFYFRNCC